MYPFLGFLVLISTAYGQIHLEGSCNLTTINYEKSLNVTELLGTWYEIQRINNTIQTGDCTSVTFTAVKNDDLSAGVKISNQEVVNNALLTRNGNITLQSSIFHVTFSDNVTFNFVVLKTNYKDYGILYSCQDVNGGKAVMGWKLSRTKTVSTEASTNFESVPKTVPDLVNATWLVKSHSEGACKINNGATNLHLSPIILLFIGLLAYKEM